MTNQITQADLHHLFATITEKVTAEAVARGLTIAETAHAVVRVTEEYMADLQATRPETFAAVASALAIEDEQKALAALGRHGAVLQGDLLAELAGGAADSQQDYVHVMRDLIASGRAGVIWDREGRQYYVTPERRRQLIVHMVEEDGDLLPIVDRAHLS